MLSVRLNDLSKYRTQLMGVSAIMIIVCHAPGSGVVMPSWLGSFLTLGSFGNDVFLFLSGMGCWSIFFSLYQQIISQTCTLVQLVGYRYL